MPDYTPCDVEISLRQELPAPIPAHTGAGIPFLASVVIWRAQAYDWYRPGFVRYQTSLTNDATDSSHRVAFLEGVTGFHPDGPQPPAEWVAAARALIADHHVSKLTEAGAA